MKQNLPPTTTLTLRSVNGSEVMSGNSGAPGVHYLLQQRPAGHGGMLSQVNHHQNGSGNQIVFRRFPNNNMVQVRRIITQQPQQFQQIVAAQAQAAIKGGGDVSSSESSVGYEPTRKRALPPMGRGIGRGRGMSQSPPISILRKETDTEKRVDNGCGDKEMDVDISIVRRKVDEDEDEEGDLLIDEGNDDDNEGGMEIEDEEAGPDDKSAIEMNGQGMSSDFLRHVVETQILNRHKTRIKDWDGTKGHMCQSCHETFLSEGGLEVHRNRRILHILFFCRYCKRDLSFFNKCRLLQHLRNHRVTPTVSSLQNCTMIRLLPESEYLHFKYEDCTSSSDEDDKDGSSGTGGSASGGSSPPKRLKPSRFRRIARSSVSNDKDSDLSPPPSSSNAPKPNEASKASPPKLSPSTTGTGSSTLSPASAITTTTAPIGTIKFAGANSIANGKDIKQQQVPVIKSTGNTTSVILPSPVAKPTAEEAPPPTPSSPESTPQIRIRSLSQLTETEKEKPSPEIQEVPPAAQFRPQIVKITSLPVKTSSEPSLQSAGSPMTTESEWRCHKCDVDFDSAQELFKHLQEAELQGLNARSLHRCPTDDIPSWSQCQYVYHTKVFHERSVRFMCPGCGLEAKDYATLLEHVTNDCFYISQRARYLCAASAQKCSFADKKSVKTEPEIVDHLKKEHSRSVLQCVHCTQGFATDNWLIKHLADAHNISFDESKGEVEREALINKTTRPLAQCLICNILFPNGPTYLQHVYLNFHMHILHAKILECQGCFAVFETNDELATHRRQSERCRKLDPFNMKICWSANEMEGIPVKGNNLDSPASSNQQAIQMTPTPIKIIANPATIITTGNKVATQQAPPQLQASPVPPQLQNQRSSPQIKQVIQSHSGSSGPLPISIIRPSANGSPAIVAVISASNSQNGTSGCTQILPPSSLAQQRSQSHAIVIQKQVNASSSGSTTITSVTTTSQKKPTQIMLPSMNKPPPAGNPPVNTAARNLLKKNFFDNLLACQFCERLVVFSSLRKHEDQCCGLSTVAPGFCLSCRKNFGDRRTLARHGVTHIQEGLPICLFCNNRHIRPTHPKSTTPSSHENLYALKKHLYSNHTSKLAKFPFQCPICDQTCKDKRQTEFHIKDHQFKYRVNPNEPDPSPLATSPEDMRKLLRVRKKGVDPKKKLGKIVEVYYCPVCKNREFTMEAGLSRHLKLLHQKNPRTLNLNMFKKTSTARKLYVTPPENSSASPSTATTPKPVPRSLTIIGDKNLRSRTSVQQLNSSASSSAKSNTSTTIANSKVVTVTSSPTTSSFTTRFSAGTVLRKRLTTGQTSPVGGKKPTLPISQRPQPPNTRQRSASTNETTSPSPSPSKSTTPKPTPAPPTRELRPPSNFLQTRSSASSKVRRKDGTFSCHKCPDFTCQTEEDFYEHVKWKHIWSEAELQKLQYGNRAGLEEPSEYWCPECNSILVAKPSLVRHLKFAHDYISNVEEYMTKIGYDGKKPLKPNQCEVCYFQCADDRELQQHMRTHGMAFLRLRQQQRQQMDRQLANKSTV